MTARGARTIRGRGEADRAGARRCARTTVSTGFATRPRLRASCGTLREPLSERSPPRSKTPTNSSREREDAGPHPQPAPEPISEAGGRGRATMVMHHADPSGATNVPTHHPARAAARRQRRARAIVTADAPRAPGISFFSGGRAGRQDCASSHAAPARDICRHRAWTPWPVLSSCSGSLQLVLALVAVAAARRCFWARSWTARRTARSQTRCRARVGVVGLFISRRGRCGLRRAGDAGRDPSPAREPSWARRRPRQGGCGVSARRFSSARLPALSLDAPDGWTLEADERATSSPPAARPRGCPSAPPSSRRRSTSNRC